MAIRHSYTRTVLAATLLLTFGGSVFASSFPATAQTDANLSFSDDEIARADRIAVADERVQNYIAGRPYSLMNHGASTNDNEPGIVRPVLLYNIDNKDQLSVTVDLRSGTVKDLLYYPDMMIKLNAAAETGNSDSTSSTGFAIIAVVAGIVAAVTVAIVGVYIKSKRKQNFNAKMNPR